MKRRKVIRYWADDPERMAGVWERLLGSFRFEYEFVPDSFEPEFLVCSERIYRDLTVRADFCRRRRGRISLFVSEEDLVPDMNLFDYAATFDRTFWMEGRVSHWPTRPLECRLPDSDANLATLGKAGFCNFIYSNPRAHERRDQIFRALTSYRRVDSLGPHLNNCGNATSRAAVGWFGLSVDMKRPYKFSIACENSVTPGYSTEKIVSSFMAHTVPIYFGDPLIAEKYNARAFIDANRLSDIELIARVREVDENDRLFAEMLRAPAMTLRQMEVACREIEGFNAFWNAVLSFGEVRVGSGTMGVDYRENFASVAWLSLAHRMRKGDSYASAGRGLA